MGHPKDVPARDTWACNPAKASCQHEVTQELEITPNQNRNTKPSKEEELGESKKIFTYELAACHSSFTSTVPTTRKENTCMSVHS
jgi:cytochrome c5